MALHLKFLPLNFEFFSEYEKNNINWEMRMKRHHWRGSTKKSPMKSHDTLNTINNNLVAINNNFTTTKKKVPNEWITLLKWSISLEGTLSKPQGASNRKFDLSMRDTL